MADPRYLPIPKFLAVYEAFSRTMLYELLKQKRLEAKKMGGKTLINCASADKYLAQLPQYKPQSGGA